MSMHLACIMCTSRLKHLRSSMHASMMMKAEAKSSEGYGISTYVFQFRIVNLILILTLSLSSLTRSSVKKGRLPLMSQTRYPRRLCQLARILASRIVRPPRPCSCRCTCGRALGFGDAGGSKAADSRRVVTHRAGAPPTSCALVPALLPSRSSPAC